MEKSSKVEQSLKQKQQAEKYAQFNKNNTKINRANDKSSSDKQMESIILQSDKNTS